MLDFASGMRLRWLSLFCVLISCRTTRAVNKNYAGPNRNLWVVFFLLFATSTCPVTWAVDRLWVGPDNGNWNFAANWQIGFVPDAGFDEAGVINNHTTAVVDFPPLTNPAGVRLGSAASTTGGLRIVSGGILHAVAGSGGETGAIAVGGAGQGNLTMLGNGILTGTSLSLGVAAGSSITLSDTASLSVSGSASLGRTTTIIGPNVNFSSDGDLTLTGDSILVPDIRSSISHSPIMTQATANIGGTLKPMFTGVTPAVGNKWTLIDAATAIHGEFSNVDLSMAPALPVGQRYQLNAETSGTRQLLRLSVEEVLTLQVNRTTGAVSIANPGITPKTFDGYSIISPHGSLTGAWNSLDDQNFGGADTWFEAAPTPTDLSELRPQAGSTTIAAGNSISIGSPYVVTVPDIGVDPDDLSFEYSLPDGRVIEASVVYTGPKSLNDFVLTVDPATGQVQLKLDSPLNPSLATSIDGYAIYSPSGSLAPATWNSLQDQSAPVPAAAGWEQAPPAPTADAVAELKADGILTFQNNTGFQLGQLFRTVGATQDLRFEYFRPGEFEPRQGTVVYGPITPVSPPAASLPGDYNGNDIVDAADYTVWRDLLGSNDLSADGNRNGTVDMADYDIWQLNFGRTAGSGSGANVGLLPVPEPATAMLVTVAAALVADRAARRRSRPAVAKTRRSSLQQSGIVGGTTMKVPRALLVTAAGFVVSLGSCAITARAQELYFENFEDAMLAPGTTTNLASISGGIASFNDTSATARASFVVQQTFTDDLMTFAFDVAAPVTATGGADNELLFRAGIGGGTSTLGSSEFILEAILFRTSDGGTAGGPRGDFINNGNETIFLVANNSDSARVFDSPIDSSLVTLDPFQYIPYVRDNATGDFGQIKDIDDFEDRNGNDPGPGTIVRFGIGSSTNAHQGTFALDNVLVTSGVSFGPVLLGDVDGNGVIEFQDFETIRANFRKSPRSRRQGDLTGDGLVSLKDFVEWKVAFVGAGGSLAGLDFGFLTVPEPSTVILGMVAALSALGHRRRQHTCSFRGVSIHAIAKGTYDQTK